jgi:hypothetical protein
LRTRALRLRSFQADAQRRLLAKQVSIGLILKTDTKNRLGIVQELKDRLQIQKISKFLSLSSIKDHLLQIKDSKLIKEFFDNTKKINKEITNKNELHKEQNDLLDTDNYLIDKFRQGLLNVIDTTKSYLFTAQGAVQAWTAIIEAVMTADRATDNFITTHYKPSLKKGGFIFIQNYIYRL